MPSRVKKLPLTAARNVRMRKRLRRSKGNRCARRGSHRRPAGRRRVPAGQHLTRAEGVFAEYFEDIRQQSDARTEQKQAGDIEGMRLHPVIIGQMR